MRFLEAIIQAVSIRPYILDFVTLGVKACLCGKYLDFCQSDIFQNSLYVEIHTITDNDQTEAPMTAEADQFRKSRPYCHLVSGAGEQAGPVGSHHSEGLGIEAADRYLTLLVFSE